MGATNGGGVLLRDFDTEKEKVAVCTFAMAQFVLPMAAAAGSDAVADAKQAREVSTRIDGSPPRFETTQSVHALGDGSIHSYSEKQEKDWFAKKLP